MYKKIMVPVDLAHTDKLAKALDTAADLANHFQIPVCYVGITTETPSSLAHTPSEYASKLETFAKQQSQEHGHKAIAKSYASHDPTTDLDNTLLTAVKEVDADLVVMASHVPGLIEHVWPSHGGKIASHSNASVFLVR
jgi:nucleotide-binding universal stress UspA family protein